MYSLIAEGIGEAVSETSMGPIFAGIFTGPAAPFVMAAAALVGPLTKIIGHMITGCGQSCIDATKYADTAEGYLRQLRDAYLAQPNKCKESQTATLQYMDGVFQWLANGCRAVGGVAGQHCISERLIKNGTAPWCPKPGNTGCDWITLYRDPVANDQSATVCSGLGGLLSGGSGGGSGDMTMMLLVILLVIIAVKKG